MALQKSPWWLRCAGARASGAADSAARRRATAKAARQGRGQALARPALVAGALLLLAIPAQAFATTNPLIVGANRFSPYGIKTTPITNGLLGTTPVSPSGQPSQAGRDSQAIGIADIDGDGDLDIIWGDNSARTIKWAPRVGTGPGDFDFSQTHVIEASTPGSGTIFPIAVGDVDGDGTNDFVTSFSDSAVLSHLYVYRNVGGTGTGFVRYDVNTALPHLGALAGKSLADANGDGKMDLFVFSARTVSASETQITVYLNTGDAAAPFSASSKVDVGTTNVLMLSSGDRWGALTAGDFDGDGIADIWAMGTITKVYFYKGNGNGTFAYPSLKVSLAFSIDKHVIDSFDIDKDGTKDLLVASGASTDTEKLRWYQGTGAGALALTPTQTISSWGTSVAAPVDPKCRHKVDGTSCADSNICNGEEICDDGLCKPSVDLADGTSCTNGNACDGAETCHSGACVQGPPPDCNDANPCTADACDPASGCVHTTAGTDGEACDDGRACTTGDRCASGECGGDETPACMVAPVLECVIPPSTGSTYTAVFGYTNRASVNAHVDIGDFNHFSPGSQDEGQPRWFTPTVVGEVQHAAVSVSFDGSSSLAWVLGESTATATSNAATCSQGTCGQDELLIGGQCVEAIKTTETQTRDTVINDSAGTTVGRTDGSFAVSNDGAATYRIPLWVPPGRMGIEPSLALVYSSQGGDGPLGMGWSLSGLSRISRCNKTHAQDGQPGAVTFTDGDAICLDGQRLIRVGGTGLQDGAEFRLEDDVFSKITVKGTDGEGPSAFEVRLRDGRIMRFGGTADAKLEGQREAWTPPADDVEQLGPADPNDPQYNSQYRFKDPVVANTTVRMGWALSKVTDRSGNALTVTYDHPTNTEPELSTAAEQLPHQIVYTSVAPSGNDDFGVQGLRAVTFAYADRPDKRTYFQSGFKTKRTKRLTTVTMSAPKSVTAGVVRTYNLTYYPDFPTVSVTGRMLLKQVEECDNVKPSAVCKPPTTFEWETGDLGYDDIDTGITDVRPASTGGGDDAVNHMYSTINVADVNQDGRDDILYRADGKWYSRLGTDAGFGHALELGPDGSAGSYDSARDPGEFVPMNLNLDPRYTGLTRVVSGAGNSTYIRLSRTDGTQDGLGPLPNPPVSDPEQTAGSWPQSPFFFMDLDGDGRPELIRGVGSSYNQMWKYRQNNEGSLADSYTSLNVGVAEVDTSLFNLGRNGFPVDLEGDGRPELLVRNSLSTSPRLTAIKGDGSAPATTSLLLASDADWGVRRRYWMVDLNGDGLTDALESRLWWGASDHGTPGWYPDLNVVINTGNGFAAPSPRMALSHSNTISDSWRADQTVDPGVRFMDYDNDGRVDVLLMDDGYMASDQTSYRDHLVVLLNHGTTFQPVQTNIPIGDTATGYRACLPEKGNQLTDCTTVDDAPYGYKVSQVLDHNGDGLSDIVQVQGGRLHIYRRRGKMPDMMTVVTDGMGARTDVTYAPTTKAPDAGAEALYTRATDCQYPQVCESRPRWVVSGIQEKNGLTANPDATNSYGYHYYDGRRDVQGRGWLGYRGRKMVDNQTGAISYTEMDNTTTITTSAGVVSAYPYAFRPIRTCTTVPITEDGRREVRLTTTTLDKVSQGDGRYFLRTTDVLQRRRVLAGTAFGALDPKGMPNDCDDSSHDHDLVIGTQVDTATSNWDDYENPQHVVVTSLSHVTETTDITYSNFANSWIIGRPTNVKVTSHRDASTPDVVREVARTYDGSTGLLITETTEPNAAGADVAALQKVTTITRYASGNPQTVTTTAAGVSRVMTYTYDPAEGIFPRRTQNALGQYADTFYHPALGVPATSVDENQLVTAWQYDGFGRLRHTSTPDGSSVSATYLSASGTPGRSMIVDVTSATGEEVKTSLDIFGRPVHQESTVFAGPSAAGRTHNVVDSAFDQLGRLASVTRPHYDGDVAGTASYTYDSIGRVRTAKVPGDTATAFETTVYAYLAPEDVCTGGPSGPTPGCVVEQVAVQNPKGHMTVTGFNDLGEVVDTLSAAAPGSPGAWQPDHRTYAYAPFGLLATVTHGDSGKATSITYDRLGRRKTLDDPDSGHTEDAYDGLGAIQTETRGTPTSPTGQHDIASFTYDVLGRLATRSDDNGGGARLTIFTWDSAANGLGRIAGTTSPDGTKTNVSYYGPGQHGAGSASSAKWTIDNETFEIKQSYDAFGRPDTTTYPDIAGLPRFQVQTGYQGGTGFLQSMTEVSAAVDGSARPRTLWQATDRDAAGQLAGETFGNGVSSTQTYHPLRGLLGSIQTKTPSAGVSPDVQDVSFQYDENGNMESRIDNLTSGSPVTESFEHDHLDRVWHWSTASWDVNYEFDGLGNLGGRKLGLPNGGTTIQYLTYPRDTTRLNAVGKLQQGGADVRTHVYDYRGNRTGETAGGGATTMTATYTSFDLPLTVTRDGVTASYEYDASETRVKKSVAGGRTTIYVGGFYERRTESNGSTVHVYYVLGAQGPVAEVIRSATAQTDQVVYLHTDHLGSVQVTTTASGGTVAVGNRQVFDPYGNKVGPLTGAPLVEMPGVSGTAPGVPGFTGQEGDDEVGFVNMRGRIFDPKVGAFLTPDPIVQAPFFGQSHNRYAYVWNRPITFVDPSGFEGAGSCSPGNPPGGTPCVPPMAPVPDSDPMGGGSGGGNGSGGGGGGGGNVWFTGEGDFDQQVIQDANDAIALARVMHQTKPYLPPGGPPQAQARRMAPTKFAGWQGGPEDDDVPGWMPHWVCEEDGGRCEQRITAIPDPYLEGIGRDLDAVVKTVKGAFRGLRNLLKSAKPEADAAKALCSRAAGSGVPLARAVEQGLVNPGGKLGRVLGGIEQGFAGSTPKSAMDALGIVQRATGQVGLEPGIATLMKGGDIVLQNVGGITTTLGANGSILVQRGPDVLLHLLP